MEFFMYFFSQQFILLKRHVGVFTGIVVAIFFLLPAGSAAQKISATASVDTNAILIGGQFTLSLEINHPSDIVVEWPAIPDTFSLFELVRRVPVDTVVNAGNNSLTSRQYFKITSFDSGYHAIPPFSFLYRLRGDTAIQKAETEPILISVLTVPVDTTKAIKDIKGNVAIPFSWEDALPYVGLALLVALLFLLGYYLIKKFGAKKLAPAILVPKRPAHEIALEELEKLDAAKLWQQGNFKAYYTGLSDITRTFIQNRWSVAAMEMTTDELLRMKIISSQDPVVLEQLKQLLELADLVKFAKVIPMHHENEQSLKLAFSFVKANQQQEVKEVDV